jgi:hypothetical protein
LVRPHADDESVRPANSTIFTLIAEAPLGPAPVLHFSTAKGSRSRRAQGGTAVLETIAIILLVLWLLGVVSGYTLGNFIYVLLVIAIVLFLVRLVAGRRVV